jgi:hypothetical protein
MSQLDPGPLTGFFQKFILLLTELTSHHFYSKPNLNKNYS